jgi:hypothetical protein
MKDLFVRRKDWLHLASKSIALLDLPFSAPVACVPQGAYLGFRSLRRFKSLRRFRSLMGFGSLMRFRSLSRF